MNKIYQIIGTQEYFKKKYGTFNPLIKIEGTDRQYFGVSWVQHHLLISMEFVDRLIAINRLNDGLHKNVYYGKIQKNDHDIGEFVLEDEIQELKNNE